MTAPLASPRDERGEGYQRAVHFAAQGAFHLQGSYARAITHLGKLACSDRFNSQFWIDVADEIERAHATPTTWNEFTHITVVKEGGC